MDDPSREVARCQEGGATVTHAHAEPSAAAVQRVALASGRSVEIAAHAGGEEHLTVRAADGTLVLSLRLTSEGPVLSLSGVSLEIQAQKRLSIGCETLSVATSGDATIQVGGSLYERTRGSAIREAGKASIERAREVKVEAFPGGVAIAANDDVDIKGERVRLNSEDPPMPLSWEEYRARQAARVTVGTAQDWPQLPEWPGGALPEE